MQTYQKRRLVNLLVKSHDYLRNLIRENENMRRAEEFINISIRYVNNYEKIKFIIIIIFIQLYHLSLSLSLILSVDQKRKKNYNVRMLHPFLGMG